MPDNEGWTALNFSVRNGSYELVAFPHDLGIDVHLKTKNGLNCLHIAALSGHINLCNTLIRRHNFDIQMPDNVGWKALHFAARNGSVNLFEYLYGMETNANLKSNNGMNYLHIAARYRNLNLCKTLLVKHNFDVQRANNDGWTALHFSAKSGSHKSVAYFHGMGININLKTEIKWNCLHIAALFGHLNLCNTLIRQHNFDVHMPDNLGRTALHFTAINGSVKLVTHFLGLVDNIYIKTKSGQNCLHIVAFYENLKLCSTLISKQNFNVHMLDNYGWTALHFSAGNGSYELILYFYRMGADIKLNTNCGMNCLHIAAQYGHLKLCKTLIDKHNFDVQVIDNNGWKALHFAAKNSSY